jgi:hypothetical protein
MSRTCSLVSSIVAKYRSVVSKLESQPFLDLAGRGTGLMPVRREVLPEPVENPLLADRAIGA